MKKILITMLVLWMCLCAFSGCGDIEYQGPLSDITCRHDYGPTTTVSMTDALQELLLSALNEGDWDRDYPNCEHDYEFTAKEASIRYHSVCGCFVDVTNKCSMMLSKEKKAAINDLLGVHVKENYDETGKGITIKLLRYTWDGWGVSQKVIADDEMAYYIANTLKDMEPTGETVPEIGDGTIEDVRYGYPIDRGTLWIEIGSKIYRMPPELDQISLVDGHLGQGTVLHLSEEFATKIAHAWQYHPKNVYSGTYTYQNGKQKIELKNVYSADSNLHIHIQDIHIEKKHDPQNTITLEVISAIDQTITLDLHCEQSSDNLARGDSKTVTLTANEAQTVTMSFGGWEDWRYFVDISAENLLINLTIEL